MLVINMATTKYERVGPKFELHGIELNGSFGVYFEEKWHLENFKYEATEVIGEDVQRLAEASKSGIEVPIKFGNGEGKAIINSFHYDPKTRTLKSISIKLTEWVPK